MDEQVMAPEKIVRKKRDTSTHIVSAHNNFSHQIRHLAWVDLQKSYRGAFLGWLWVVVKPLVMLGLYWFVVAIGFQSDSIRGETYHYFPWLLVGLCAWFFIWDMINAGVGAFRKYKFLIAKTKFPVATIPTIITLSNLIVHGILLTIVLGYLYFAGYFALEWLQLPIYVILTVGFVWFWALLAAPLGAMSKDFMHLVKSLMRALVWVSGILWSIQSINVPWVREVMELNPIYYLAEGYRKSLIYHEWFFEDLHGLMIFMIELAILAILAIVVYKRSRKELVDIL